MSAVANQPQAEFGTNDHQADAPRFTFLKASNLTLYSEPPLIIKPSYEIPVVNQGVSEERLDDRLGELKNWIESELLHKLIEGKSKPVI